MNIIYNFKLYPLSITLFLFTLVFGFLPSSLWLDEAAIGANVLGNDWKHLLVPLNYGQVAPVGWLLLMKLNVSIFPINDFTIRLPNILALFIVILIIEKQIQSSKHKLVNYSIILLCFGFFKYGFELKQYIFDVLFITYFYFVWFNRNLTINYFIIFILTWLSNIALILSIPFIIIYGIEKSGLKSLKDRFSIYLFFAINIVVYYFFFIHNHPHSAGMIQYWRDGFMPQDSTVVFWLVNKGVLFFNQIASTPIIRLNWILGFVTFVLLVISTIPKFTHLLKIQKAFISILVLVLPFLVHLFLSVLGKFPFEPGRLTIYLIIPVMFALIHTNSILHTRIKNKFLLYSFIIAIGGLSFVNLFNNKILNPAQHIRPFLGTPTLSGTNILVHSSIKQYDYYNLLFRAQRKKINFYYCRVLNDLNLLKLNSDSIVNINIIESHSKILQTHTPQTLMLDSTKYRLSNINSLRGMSVYTYRKN
jgi:hypothetical protein